MEIAEDEEEDNRKRQSTVMEERPPTAKAVSVSGAAESAPSDLPPLSIPLPLSSTNTSQSINTLVESLHTEPPPPRSPTKSIDEAQPRKSSQSTRPDLYSYSSYGSNGKPKVKLGPRPSLDVSGGRPHTSGAASHYRPISTLPVGLKLSKGSRKGPGRPASTYNTEAPSMMISPPPLPEGPISNPSRPHTSGGRPPPSPNPSLKAMTPSPITPKIPAITPEKARLMKALELRKKQMSAPPPTEPLSPISSEGLTSPIVASNRVSGAPKEVHDTLAMLNDMAKGDDSGIAFDASSTLKTDESDATRSDSYPVSPVGPSEQAESTRASSISDDTDETVQEGNIAKPSTAEEQTLESKTPESVAVEKQEDVGVVPQDEEIQITDAGLEQLQPRTYDPTIEIAVLRMTPEIAVESEETTPIAKMEEPILDDVPQDPISTDAATIEFAVDEAKTEALPESIVDAASPTKSDVDESKIPRSKFSSQNLRTGDNVPEIPTEPLPPTNLETSMDTPQKSPVGSTFSDTKRSITDDQENNGPKKRKKRKALMEPIRTDLDLTDRSGHNSEANFSSDDDLMDELHSAVVQEAKPISVSKSPITPVFPTTSPRKRESWRNRVSRVVSNPTGKPESLAIPAKMESSRSVSAGAKFLNKINQQQAKPMATKVNVGSGISQRIKALEKLSSNPGAPALPSPGPSPGNAPSFFSVRKGSVRGTSPSIAERANSLNRSTPSPAASRDVSRESSPETWKIRDRSSSIKGRVGAFESSPIPMNQPTRSRPESISVTARIIRDPAQPFQPKPEVGKDPSEYAPLDLKQSPLVIDHQKAVTEPPKERETIQERRMSKERRLSSSSNTTNTTAKNRRSSITIVKDLINEGRQSFAERRRSIEFVSSLSSPSIRSSSRPPSLKSPSKPPSAHASPMHKRSTSTTSRLSTNSRNPTDGRSPPPTAGSSSSASEEKEKKSSNRASRMLRRMSSSLSRNHKSHSHAVSPTVREESEAVMNGSGNDSNSFSNPPTPNINIGDVNVQFPDTLLWKRRSMLLDNQGFLILSPALTASGNGKGKSNGGATRKFHLSEFRTPSVPDVEMQELPNSVVLEFLEGGVGGLQIACEDRVGQGRILEGKIFHPLLLNHF